MLHIRWGIGADQTDGALSMLEVTIPPKTLIKPGQTNPEFPKVLKVLLRVHWGVHARFVWFDQATQDRAVEIAVGVAEALQFQQVAFHEISPTTWPCTPAAAAAPAGRKARC